MFRKILLPIIHANLSRRTVDYAVNYAKAARGDIVLLSLTPAKPMHETECHPCVLGMQMGASPVCEAAGILELVLEKARRASVYCDVVNRNSASLSEAIIECSKQYCCDVVYLEATRNPNVITSSISDSVINEVVKGTSISVLVFR